MVFKKKSGKSLSKHSKKKVLSALLRENAESHIRNIRTRKSMKFAKRQVAKKKKKIRRQRKFGGNSTLLKQTLRARKYVKLT